MMRVGQIQTSQILQKRVLVMLQMDIGLPIIQMAGRTVS